MRPLIILALAYLVFVAVAFVAEIMAGLVFVFLGLAGVAAAVVLVRANRRLTAQGDRRKS